MADQSKPDKSRIEALEKALKWSREEERHEVNWIGHRLGWLLISQSFLITAAVMSQSNDYPWWYGPIASGILGVLGVWLSLRGIIAIRAAQTVIDKGWLKKEAYICEEAKGALNLYRLNRGLHRRNDTETRDFLHDEAMHLHGKIGWVFIFAWISIYLLSLISGAAQGFKAGNVVFQVPVSRLTYLTIGILVLLAISTVFFLKYREINEKLKVVDATFSHLLSDIGDSSLENNQSPIPSENAIVLTDPKPEQTTFEGMAERPRRDELK